MKKIFSYVSNNLPVIFRGFLFILTIFIIVSLFPRKAKFKYEFQKGNPWLYETLIAPFDFPIYKSEEQLKSEKDSVLNNAKAYFEFDSLIVKNNKVEFSKSYEIQKQEFIVKNSKKLIGRKYSNFVKNSNDFFDFAQDILHNIYSKGIIESPEMISEYNSEYIVILREKVAESHFVSDIYTQKSAYAYSVDKISEFIESINKKNNLYIDFIRQVDIYKYIMPNLIFDKSTTENVKNEMLKDVSFTKGMIQTGERIVSKGEVVNFTIYQALKSFKKQSEEKLGLGNNSTMIFFGHLLFIIICITVLFLFLLNFRKEILQDSLKTAFILIIVLIFVTIASIVLKYSIDSIYIIPFAIIPIIIRTFYDARLALFIHIVVVMLVGFFAPNGFEFVFLNFNAGIVAIFTLTDLHRRGKLFFSAALVVITYSIIYFGMYISYEGNISDIKLENFLYFGANGVLLLISYPLIYLFEKVFGFLSDVTLLELSDTNQPLLRKLAEKAPGTFQHSLQVANLAEEAVYKIGGNPLLVRTGALYHDVGKMDNSICFIENQNSGYNPHDYLEFDESAKIIINHVILGEKIAKKNKLPQKIIDFINTHHGESRVEYFYRLYQNKFPEQTIDVSRFTYPGPKPNSIETAVLMMADTVEAASRSLDKVDEDAINSLVDSLIDKQIENGQYENAPLTFKDINIIKRIFKQKLVNIYHARIVYPEENKTKKTPSSDKVDN